MFDTKSRANKRATSDNQLPATATKSDAKKARKRTTRQQDKAAEANRCNEANRLTKLEQKRTAQQQKADEQRKTSRTSRQK